MRTDDLPVGQESKLKAEYSPVEAKKRVTCIAHVLPVGKREKVKLMICL